MLEKILTEISKLTVLGFLKKGWERFKKRQQNSENASHDYKSPYEKRHGQLQAFCVGMEPSRSLDDVYVVVQFLNKRRATKYNSIEDVEEVLRKKGRRYFTSTLDKRQGGMRVANNEQYLMVLGGPGVGKSTFLRKVGLEALKGEDGNFEHQCIPVFLELKRFTKDSIGIEAWITEEFKICGHPYPEQWANSKLKSGELLILFDGLDEVPESNLNDVINKIRDFVHQYSQNRFIASCRVGAYTGGLTDFAVVEMADFDNSQIQEYIDNRFASASNREMKIAQRCWQALNDPEHQVIKALAQNPLALALLCQVYEKSQDFSSSQANLYEDIFNIFLEEWAKERGVHRDPPMSRYLVIPIVKELLSEIAAENFKANRIVFSKNELIDQIQEFYQQRTDISSRFDASKVLGALLVDPGLFVERANGIYSFFHLTFQEYLTANHFVKTQSIQNVVPHHLHDSRWREVFLFSAALMPQADDLLIAMTITASRFVNTDRVKALFQWAEQITKTSDCLYNGGAKRAFAIRQYFSLWLLDTTYEVVQDDISRNLGLNLYSYTLDKLRASYDTFDDFDEDFNFHHEFGWHLQLDLYLDLDCDLDLYRNLNLNLYRDLDIDFDLYRDLSLDLDLCHYRDNYYRELYLYFDLDYYLYLCGYMDTYFYFLVSSEFADRFEKELDLRITLIERMERAKILNVNLHPIIQRFKAQREFIKVSRKGEAVKPLEKSIRDTWLSVFGITDTMLAISRGEMIEYLDCLHIVQFIVECKKIAQSVSPEVWQEIEDRFLVLNVEEFEN